MSIVKNMRDDGVAMTPSGYNIKKCAMVRYDGGYSTDITNLVTSLTLVESLYSPTVILKLAIKDAANFLEEFPIIGQERIHIILERVEHDTGRIKRIDCKFIVTEYPLFGKDAEKPLISSYTLSAISEHAYIGSLKEVSRSFNGPLIEEIKKLLIENGMSNILSKGKGISAAAGVLPFLKSNKAIEWFRSRTVNEGGSPLFVYQTIDGIVHLDFYSDLINEKRYGVYRDGRFFTALPHSLLDYKQRASRLLECASNLRFGKIFQAKAGAFASTLDTVDIATKRARTLNYGYNIEEKGRMGNEPFSSLAVIQNTALNERADSFSLNVSLNSKAFSSNNNTNENRARSEQKSRSFMECMETMHHDIKIYGDYEFNPGKMIEIKFPRALDPSEKNKSKFEDHPSEDKLLSGKYLITSCTHSFSNGEYYINARVKRDSIGVKI